MAEFRGETADEVAEKLGIYMREKLEAGATTRDALLIVMRSSNGYVGAAGSRRGFLDQLLSANPEVAAAVARDTRERPGYVPLIAMDMVEMSHGVQWLGPFPNASGGAA